MTYQPIERTHNKVGVADTQLDCAIQAYGRGEDIIAVTLASAAEDIFGALCCFRFRFETTINCSYSIFYDAFLKKPTTTLFVSNMHVFNRLHHNWLNIFKVKVTFYLLVD